MLIVHGSDKLGGADYTIGPDYIEIGSFIALAATSPAASCASAAARPTTCA